MQIKLIDDFGKKWYKLWSLWLLIASAILQVAVDVVPYLDEYVPPRIMLWLTLAAGIARVIKQEWPDDPPKAP